MICAFQCCERYPVCLLVSAPKSSGHLSRASCILLYVLHPYHMHRLSVLICCGQQVHRISAAVVTDGESEYCDPDDMWDGFSANFIEFLENILLHPSPHCTDVLVRYDVLSCIMRLLKVCCCNLCAIPQEFGSKSCRRNLLPPWKFSLSSAQHPPTTAQ